MQCPRGVHNLVKMFMLWKKSKEERLDWAPNQRRGDMSYEVRCKILKWPTLSVRQDYFTLIECYKIVLGLSHLRFEDFLSSQNYPLHDQTTNINYTPKLARVNCYKFSFFIRVIPIWNNLPSCVVEAESFNIFKSRHVVIRYINNVVVHQF